MIVPMKRLTLVALKSEEERIIQALQVLSVVQIIETEQARPSEPSLAEAEGAVLRLNNALSILKPYAKKPGMLTSKPETTIEHIQSGMNDALAYSREIETADRKKAALHSQIDKCQNQITVLLPWASLTTKLHAVRASASTALFAGMLNTEQLAALAELPEDVAVQYFGGGKETAVLVLCPDEEQAATSAFLKNLDWVDVTLPSVPMTAAEAISEAEREIKVLQAELETLEHTLTGLGEHRALIAAAADGAAIARDRVQAKNMLLLTEDTFVLEAWVRSDREAEMQKAVGDITDAYFLEFREPTEEEALTQPSVVQNNKLVQPYEAVTNLYSRPDPSGIDATPLMMPWYFLLFGMMLGDTGYGIVLSIGAFLFLKKVKPEAGMMSGIANVLMWGGVSTIIWGPLIGTIFGMDWNVFLSWLMQRPVTGFPLIVDPGQDPITMLIICFGLGLLHIFCGMGIKMYMSFRQKDWQTAIFDNLSWIVIIVGLLVFALVSAASTVGLVMAVTGALTTLIFKGRDKPKVRSRVVSGLAGLYDISGYLTDLLSYARLFALGIATGVIGSVFNQLIGMIMAGGSFWLVKAILYIIGAALLVALHLFNIGINTLGTFIHCARLQYVEFYGKFYEAGGKEFKPLQYRTKHTKIRST